MDKQIDVTNENIKIKMITWMLRGNFKKNIWLTHQIHLPFTHPTNTKTTAAPRAPS